ncbi:MAG: HepT-like ribonuclease domain-containing protein [Sulfuriferula sp.]
MLKAVERIDRYTADMDEVGFLNSELVQDAVIRNIEIIGEASNNIQRVAPEFVAQHDDIPWQVMYTMRNRVSHGYDKVTPEKIEKSARYPRGRDDWPSVGIFAQRGKNRPNRLGVTVCRILSIEGT